ncbi:MAG: NUDIX domain-containing protein [Candidatus Sungbacteria bacterium]|uniref:8-oxo-dGTP diphosphatase n=1 Tax=Candidatus Sungiibacteriota bacterium TaxID=2750080 RepID=A0A931WNK6_9BACT|nr:NUDIX domain-containing protein [Candidatus Sungbacteria bacterium]
MEKNQNFHVGLKAFVQKGRKLLILQESDRYKSGGKWELPGGRIKETESDVSSKDILERELKEECGRTLKVKVGEIVSVWIRGDHPDAQIFLVGFECKYKSGQPTLSNEHISYAWIEKGDVRKYNFAGGYLESIKEFFKKV